MRRGAVVVPRNKDEEGKNSNTDKEIRGELWFSTNPQGQRRNMYVTVSNTAYKLSIQNSRHQRVAVYENKFRYLAATSWFTHDTHGTSRMVGYSGKWYYFVCEVIKDSANAKPEILVFSTNKQVEYRRWETFLKAPIEAPGFDRAAFVQQKKAPPTPAPSAVSPSTTPGPGACTLCDQREKQQLEREDQIRQRLDSLASEVCYLRRTTQRREPSLEGLIQPIKQLEDEETFIRGQITAAWARAAAASGNLMANVIARCKSLGLEEIGRDVQKAQRTLESTLPAPSSPPVPVGARRGESRSPSPVLAVSRRNVREEMSASLQRDGASMDDFLQRDILLEAAERRLASHASRGSVAASTKGKRAAVPLSPTDNMLSTSDNPNVTPWVVTSCTPLPVFSSSFPEIRNLRSPTSDSSSLSSSSAAAGVTVLTHLHRGTVVLVLSFERGVAKVSVPVLGTVHPKEVSKTGEKTLRLYNSGEVQTLPAGSSIEVVEQQDDAVLVSAWIEGYAQTATPQLSPRRRREKREAAPPPMTPILGDGWIVTSSQGAPVYRHPPLPNGAPPTAPKTLPFGTVVYVSEIVHGGTVAQVVSPVKGWIPVTCGGDDGAPILEKCSPHRQAWLEQQYHQQLALHRLLQEEAAAQGGTLKKKQEQLAALQQELQNMTEEKRILRGRLLEGQTKLDAAEEELRKARKEIESIERESQLEKEAMETRLSELNDILTESQAQQRDFVQKLEQLEEEKNEGALLRHSRALQEKVHQQAEELCSLEESREQMSRRLEEDAERQEESAAQTKRLQDDLAGLSRQLEVVRSRSASLEVQLAEAEAAFSEADKQRAALRKQTKELQEQLATLAEEQELKDHRNAALLERVAFLEQQEKHSGDVQAELDKLKEDERTLAEERDVLMEQMRKVLSQHETACNEKGVLLEKAGRFSIEKEAVEELLSLIVGAAAERDELHAAERDSLRSENEMMTSTSAGLESQLVAAAAELTGMQTQIEELTESRAEDKDGLLGELACMQDLLQEITESKENEYRRLLQEKDALENQLVRAAQELGSLQEQIELLTASRENDKEALLTELESMQLQLEVITKSTAADKERLEVELAEKERVAGFLESHVKQMTGRLEELERTVAELQSMRQRYDAMASAMTQLKEEKAASQRELRTVIENLEQEKKAADALLQQTEERLHSTLKERDEISDDMEKLQEQMDDLGSKVRTHEVANRQLKWEHQKLTEALEEKEQEMSAHAMLATDLKRQLTNKKKTAAAFESSLRSQEEKIAELHQRIKEKEAHITELMEQVSSTEVDSAVVAALKQQVSALELKKKRATQALQEKVQQMEEGIRSKDEEIRRLEEWSVQQACDQAKAHEDMWKKTVAKDVADTENHAGKEARQHKKMQELTKRAEMAEEAEWSLRQEKERLQKEIETLQRKLDSLKSERLSKAALEAAAAAEGAGPSRSLSVSSSASCSSRSSVRSTASSLRSQAADFESKWSKGSHLLGKVLREQNTNKESGKENLAADSTKARNRSSSLHPLESNGKQTRTRGRALSLSSLTNKLHDKATPEL